jgi:glutaredoxin 3
VKEFTVYHKEYCPYCKSARKLLNKLGWKYRLIDVSADVGAFTEMVARSGRRTVPQVFNGDTHIGGSDDLHRYVKKLGKLK